MLEQYFSNLSMIVTLIGLTLMLVGIIYATISATLKIMIDENINIRKVIYEQK